MGDGLRHRLEQAGARFGRVAYPVVALLILGSAVVSLPDSLRAARNEGVLGTLTVTRATCLPWLEKVGPCMRDGDFVSQDGTIQLRDVQFKGRGRVGDALPAQSVDPGSRVVHKLDSNEWFLMALGGLVAGGYLIRRVIQAVRRSTGSSPV